MGRPKGSKNKKTIQSPEDKIKALGLTIDDIRALLGSQDAEPKMDTKADFKKQMMTAPISPAELKKLRAESAENMAKVVDPQSVVNRAIAEVVKPSWNTAQGDGSGLKHFLVNSMRHGESVSMDKERWDLGLKQAGLRGALVVSKPEIGLDENEKTVNRWRLMIG